MTRKPWEGRFGEKTHRSVEEFTSSIEVDRRLYAHDIDGSMAHARMLAATGIISEEECSQLLEGLGKIRREIERGRFSWDDSLEDIHMWPWTPVSSCATKPARCCGCSAS